MKNTAISATALGMILCLAAFPGLAADTPSNAELWEIIQRQQQEIEALRRQTQDTDEKAEAAAAAVEDADIAGSSWTDRTRIGGYAEVHYNNLDGDGGAADQKEIDVHRVVLFLGHEFTDDIRFFSELEIEHGIASHEEDDPGEVEVEQAWLEFDLNDRHRARAGVMLLPVGILNETHEPATFYGVERNPVEHDIIPATWWAGGAGLSGQLAPGWSYDVVLHEGLNTSADEGYQPRHGRQKTAEAVAEDLAATARLRWTGIPGVELAGSIQYQSDITQGTDPDAGKAMLYEAHAQLERGPFALRALYALWDLDGSGPADSGADEQNGFYIEPSWKLNRQLGVFARYNQWDNAAGDSSDSENTQWDFGVNYWPHEDVVIKADYQLQDNDSGDDQDGFNLGVGLQF